jgi:hypothetical protein
MKTKIRKRIKSRSRSKSKTECLPTMGWTGGKNPSLSLDLALNHLPNLNLHLTLTLLSTLWLDQVN